MVVGKKVVGEEEGFKIRGSLRMEIVLLEKNKEKNTLSFILKGADYIIANMIRRYIMENLPVMAVEDVEIRKNNSVLYDGMIAHRLGLIVLKTDLKSYELIEKCKCKGKGCARCTLKLTLKASGPGYVYASEIKSKDPKIKPAYPKTPIVKLLKGQDIELEATAILGKGKTHTKWSPAHVFYKYRPYIEITEKCNNCGNCVEKCSLKVLELKKETLQINKDNLLKCNLCKACEEICEKSAIKLTEKKDEFVFYIENFGQLEFKDLNNAMDIFKEHLDEFAEHVKKALA
jgi:DNA-directed RNA polymerase subunit D